MNAKVYAYAKINLTLDILGKREDGYHNLNTIMQSVNLYDTVTVKTDESKKITITTGKESIPEDETNTAYKAAVAFFKHTNIENPGLHIKIKKRIPSEAGLAGGSADAAGTIIALNEMFKTNLSIDIMMDIGENIGADVPFCIHGGTMFAEGIGTTISPLFDCPECYILICKPDISVSTAEAYNAVDNTEIKVHPNTQQATDAICSRDLSLLGRSLGNVFEEVMKLDKIEKIKKTMIKCGALGACMTGSGSAVFGIFDEKSKVDSADTEIKSTYRDTFICEPVTRGVVIK